MADIGGTAGKWLRFMLLTFALYCLYYYVRRQKSDEHIKDTDSTDRSINSQIDHPLLGKFAFTGENSGRHHFSTRTAYRSVRGQDLGSETIHFGCSVEQLYMVVRHGTRYPGQDEIQDINSLLPDVRDKIIQHKKKGELLESVIDALKNWSSDLNPDSDLTMAPAGLEEMYSLGVSVGEAYADLFNLSKGSGNVGGKLMDVVEVRHTDNPRCQISAEHLLRGITKKQNFTTDQLERSMKKSAQEDDNLLLYCDTCRKYVKERVSMNDREKEETIQFDQSSYLSDVLQNLTLRLGLSERVTFKELSVMYEACRYGYALEDDVTWCDVLGDSALTAMEYRQDMKYYWRYGYGRKINYQASCLLLKDFMKAISDVAAGRTKRRAHFRIGHSRTVLPILARLGFFKDLNPLIASNYNSQRNRLWRLSLINPFASNALFVVVKCNGELYIRAYVNEHQVEIPGCSQPYCKLQDVFTRWRRLITNCDFKALCDTDFDLKSIGTLDIHHL